MSKKINVPGHFKVLINNYGFEDKQMLDKAVAIRYSPNGEWCAILFHDADEDEYFAIDFQYYGEGGCPIGIVRVDGWELQNDYVGPFESVREFQTKSLKQGFFV